MHKILRFVGFGGLNESKMLEYGVPLDELPKDNQHSAPDKVTAIQCETKRQLTELFEPWNNALYTMLQEDIDDGNAPPEQQPFLPFTESVPCGDEERFACNDDDEVGCEQWQDYDA